MKKKVILYVDKKTCDNCDDAIVCWSTEKYGKVCSDWDISLDAFNEAIDELPQVERKRFLSTPIDFIVKER